VNEFAYDGNNDDDDNDDDSDRKMVPWKEFKVDVSDATIDKNKYEWQNTEKMIMDDERRVAKAIYRANLVS
jgi:hypothetical protein